MTFFSLEFSLIFLIFFIFYWALNLNLRAQNLAILAFNYAFICTFSPIFALVILLHTLFVFYFGLFIAFKRGIFALFFSLFFILAYLCFFKYFELIWGDFRQILLLLNLEWLAANLEIAFPIGISFYTFTSVTYLVNIYQKKHAPASFLSLACYLSFFATILAGPIARSDFMLPQFEKKREFADADKIFALILFGVIKKVLIANYLQNYVTAIFNDPQSYDSVQILAAIYGYGIWLYCDFSGYVDIVTALALALGFSLPINFNMPYAALNLRDFWRRWHISLSNFIRDYVYIPLGGNKRGFFLTQVNLLIAFILSGLWHGVGWGFLIWGLLHGFGVMCLNLLSKFRVNFSEKIPFLGRFITFNFVSFAWIYFAKSDINEANLILLSLIENFASINLNECVILGGFLIFIIAIYPYLGASFNLLVKILSFIPFVFKPILFAIIFSAVFAIMPDGVPSFIYSSF